MFRKIVGNPEFSDNFCRIVICYKRKGYNIDVIKQSPCLAVNQIMVDHFANLFNCTPFRRYDGPDLLFISWSGLIRAHLIVFFFFVCLFFFFFVFVFCSSIVMLFAKLGISHFPMSQCVVSVKSSCLLHYRLICDLSVQFVYTDRRNICFSQLWKLRAKVGIP